MHSKSGSGKRNPLSTSLLFGRGVAEEHEEQMCDEHDHVAASKSFAGLLNKNQRGSAPKFFGCRCALALALTMRPKLYRDQASIVIDRSAQPSRVLLAHIGDPL